MDRISVIIPVYQAEEFLDACLDSVLGQSFRELEVIAVDDGSTDRSWEILTRRAGLDPQLRILRQENRGQGAARNRGVDTASGEWVCFVDSDDLVHPKMLESLYRAAVTSGCAIAQCRMAEGRDCPQDFLREQPDTYSLLPMDENTLERLHRDGRYPGWVACGKLIRRDIVRARPFQEGRVYEDNEAVCHWLVKAGSLADVPLALYFYRTNPDSTTKSAFSLKKLDYLWALEHIMAFYGSLGWESLEERFLELYVQAVGSFYSGVKNDLGLPRRAWRMERDSRRFLRENGIRLSTSQREFLLDIMHPGLAKIYWPAAGAVRTYRSEGLTGVAAKIRKMTTRR